MWILGSTDGIRIPNLIQVQAAQRKMGYSLVIVPSLQKCHPAFVTTQAWQQVCDTTNKAAVWENLEKRLTSAQLELYWALNCTEPGKNLMSVRSV